MAERRRVVVDVGDRAAVSLQADARHGGIRRVAVQQRLDRAVGQLAEVVALPVAPVRMAFDAVVAGLEFECRRARHDLTRRGAPTERSAGSIARPAVRVAYPHISEGGGVAGDVGGERGLTGGLLGQVAPAAERRGGAIEREGELCDQGPCADGMQPELELDDDSEVAATAAQSPEQVGVLGRRPRARRRRRR